MGIYTYVFESLVPLEKYDEDISLSCLVNILKFIDIYH